MAKSKLDNFWTKKRDEYNFTIKDVAKIMEVSAATARGYFSGLCMPSKTKIAALCEACNVPVETGTHEFHKAYNLWPQRHPGYVRAGNSYSPVEKKKQVPLYTPELAPEHSDAVKSRRSSDSVDNFWTHKKVEKDVSYGTIAAHLSLPYTTTRSFFTGRQLPSQTTIQALCEYLDVDFAEGSEEFIKLHTAYWEAAKQTRRKAKAKTITGQISLEDITPAAEPAVEPATAAPADDMSYLKDLYGKIPFDVFQRLLTIGIAAKDVLSTIYGVVDYATYKTVASIL